MTAPKRLTRAEEERIALRIAVRWAKSCLRILEIGETPAKLSYCLAQPFYLPGHLEEAGYLTQILTAAAATRIKKLAIRAAAAELNGNPKLSAVAAHFIARSKA